MSHICIIEDDAAIAEIERDYLEINGFTVSIATDGVSGLNLAQTESFDLILLDLMLPQLDGFTLCRKLRERLDIPILMVTAKKEDIDKIRGLGLGADDYIVKPFSPGETQQEIAGGAIRICPKSHRVVVREQEVSLKNKEYELLLFLVTNADTVFDRETLYERIWGMDAMGDNATVAVHINRLREKLEEDPSHPKYIETVWGAGYRFHA